MKNKALKNYYYQTIRLIDFEDLTNSRLEQLGSSQGFKAYKRQAFTYKLFGYAFIGMIAIVVLMAIATQI